MMNELYGEAFAQQVANRLEELSPKLNEIIQGLAYEQIWARSGLSVRDKSLIAVTTLVALGREEQTKIHMTGFLRSGGTVQELEDAEGSAPAEARDDANAKV
jgi:4-carboxymuconolactone decarboxylase